MKKKLTPSCFYKLTGTVLSEVAAEGLTLGVEAACVLRSEAKKLKKRGLELMETVLTEPEKRSGAAAHKASTDEGITVEVSSPVADAMRKAMNEIRAEIAVIEERDPAARSKTEILLLYSGLHAVLAYRVAHKLYLTEHYFPARLISQAAKFVTGIEIHPGATIGKGLFIDHGTGVVIGETTEIGDNCTLYQGVTLGGTGKDVGKRHPTLGNNVMVGAGAKVLGPFRIGDGAKIASNAVVLEEVPDNSTAVGIPARVVRRNNKKVQELDHIHIPDPVSQELCKLLFRIEQLEKALSEQGIVSPPQREQKIGYRVCRDGRLLPEDAPEATAENQE